MTFTTPILLPGGKALIVGGKFHKHAQDCCCAVSCVEFHFSGGGTDGGLDVKFTPGSGASATDPGVQQYVLTWNGVLWTWVYNQLHDGSSWTFTMSGTGDVIPVGGYNFNTGTGDWALTDHTGGGSDWDVISIFEVDGPCMDSN